MAAESWTFDTIHSSVNFWVRHLMVAKVHGRFAQQASEEFKQAVKEKLAIRLAFLSKGLGDKRFLLGDDFSIADGYVLYFLRTWRKFAKGELDGVLAAYEARVVERPAVRAALDAEGLS